MFVIKA